MKTILLIIGILTLIVAAWRFVCGKLDQAHQWEEDALKNRSNYDN